MILEACTPTNSPLLDPRGEAELEIWGAVECTCNRVAGQYFDQMDLSGHSSRLTDYDRFAALGLRTLRVGLLWERHALTGDWADTDEQLACLRRLNIRPVAGLVHHGSGPRHTDLLDPAFPALLARYAGSVAERYPWIDAYTPVNEPNTTARFSALYGIWYPHDRSRRSYLLALLHELKGTVLSMEAIRRVQPKAQLIQTEDVGNITGTEELRSTWELLDLRQWLSFDLLCGKVDRHHPMFAYIVAESIPAADVLWFMDHPCPPSVIGVNYYLTSDRYVDHRVERYPHSLRSAEGPFVDIERVRVHPEGILGVEPILTQAWQRFGIPVAVTEVHLGSSVDEQIRWLAEIWTGIQAARRGGVECVALTVWALLGSFYWNKLVTCNNGHYEAGVFDVSGKEPVATELASIVWDITQGRAPAHPALGKAGWWRHDSRIHYAGLTNGNVSRND